MRGRVSRLVNGPDGLFDERQTEVLGCNQDVQLKLVGVGRQIQQIRHELQRQAPEAALAVADGLAEDQPDKDARTGIAEAATQRDLTLEIAGTQNEGQVPLRSRFGNACTRV